MRRRISIQPAGCLVADPPWKHRNTATKPGAHWGGAGNHYLPMTTEEIKRFPLPKLADDCWLFLWRLHTHQRAAFEVAEAWGFDGEPCSELVWIKQTKDAQKVRYGLGFTFRLAHEVCLVFKRGKPQRMRADLSSEIHAPRLEHSRKPDAFYQRVDDLVGGVHRVELFARRQWKNWTCLGNEMPGHRKGAA